MHISRAITAVAGCTKVGKYQSGKEAMMTNHQRTNSMTMTRTRASASFARATAVVGAAVLSGTLAMPVAHADLGSLRARVVGARSTAPCSALNYSTELEGEAQALSGNTLPGVPPTGQYKGTFQGFPAEGDPAEQAEIRTEVKADGAIKDCANKDFGVGFFRTGGHDNVAIVLGKPAAAPAVKPADPVKPADKPAPAEVAPTNAVALNFNRAGLQLKAVFVNSAKVSGQCHYDAEPAGGTAIGGKTDDFPIGANATVTRTYPGPVIGSTYHVTVSCHGNFNGQDVEFGHVDRTDNF